MPLSIGFAHGIIKEKGERAMLPKDSAMLLSFVNMKLRDEYDSLDALCDDLGEDRAEIERRLGEAGYAYDGAQNAFKRRE